MATEIMEIFLFELSQILTLTPTARKWLNKSEQFIELNMPLMATMLSSSSRLLPETF